MMAMIYACLKTVSATGATIVMVAPGQFRLKNGNPRARALMRDHGYVYDRRAKLWA